MESAHGERGPSPEEEETKEVRLLREMMLRARLEGEEEPQVLDEHLHANDQLQRDEIHVHCEIPDGIIVSAEGVDDDTDSRFFHSFSVQHLPPISLTCLMPLSYPSHHPPYFTLSVPWLHNVKISSLCHMLDLIRAQKPGQEVVYEWVQWLQNSVLSHLGFDDAIAIHHSDSPMGPIDVRAVGEVVPVESVIQWLISYNEEQCHETFLGGLHDCMICLSEYAGVDFIKLPCQHYFCWRCMETYSRMHVKEGTVLKLLCPDNMCQGDVPPNLLKRLLGDADFNRWERLILQKTLDSMADVAYCPRCETVSLEDEENNAQCSKCFFSFCTRCRLRCHIGERCIGSILEVKLLSSQEREKVLQLSKGDIEKTISLAKEICSIKEVAAFLSVQCPRCGIGISRVSGCNSMVCGNCGQLFCYACGVVDCQGCRKGSTGQGNVEVDVSPFLRAQADATKETPKEVTTARSRQYPCPSCRQPNPKVGNNNHMFCWACQVHYCALCRKVVRKYTDHYGPRGCKQHSVDPIIHNP